jgi:hypothetical protein
MANEPRNTPWQVAVGIAGLAVVLWVGTDLYRIIDVGLSRPAVSPNHAPQQAPAGDAPSPPANSPHDPSKFNHG